VMKGLSMTYAKDMQEDKELVFGAVDTLSLCLAAMTGMVKDMAVNAGKMRAAAASGFATATDLADWLVRTLKLPFREAHHITGRIVKAAEAGETGDPGQYRDYLLPPPRASWAGGRAARARAARAASA